VADNAESRQEGARVRLPPPVAYVAAVVVGWLLPGLRYGGTARIVVGALLLACGIALVLGALRLFRQTGQNPTPWTPSPLLVGAGPYRHTRNPMYVGMTLLTLGVASLSGHVWIALLAPVALAVVHFTAVLPEERYLASKFGESYTEYTKQVRRYI
jgi:protein-S-isoprenylcysteine O-methyltransferase Ste14